MRPAQGTLRTIKLRGSEFAVRDCGEVCFVNHEQLGFWDTFEADGFDRQLTDLIDRLVKPGKVFVDVGAWVGAFSLYAAARGALVVAVEPDPVASARLFANIDNDDLDVRLECVAVTTENGIAEMVALSPGSGLSQIAARGERTFPVVTSTLPVLLDEIGISPEEVALVKIDIEGYEIELLPTLAPWLAGHKIPVHVSLHGRPAERSWFKDYPTVSWPETLHGDIVALPFLTLDGRGLM